MFSSFRNAIPSDLLNPAIAAGRAALRRLEDDDVPAKLRKVAAYQGGRLPGPLAKRILGALDEDDWLRGKAIDELGDTDPQAAGPDGASALFLLRPDGWDQSFHR